MEFRFANLLGGIPLRQIRVLLRRFGLTIRAVTRLGADMSFSGLSRPSAGLNRRFAA